MQNFMCISEQKLPLTNVFQKKEIKITVHIKDALQTL